MRPRDGASSRPAPPMRAAGLIGREISPARGASRRGKKDHRP